VKGFTFIEVLVSIGIMVLVMAILYSAYTGNLRAMDIAQDQEISFQTARIVLDMMERDLTSAVASAETMGFGAAGHIGFLGESDEYEGLPADRLQFTCFSHLAWSDSSPKTDFCEVGYFLEEDEDTGRLTLFRRDQAMPDEDLEQGGERMVLSEDITGFDVLYTNEEGDELEEWDSRSGDLIGRLPLTVKIRLTIKGLSGKETAFTTKVHPALAGTDKQE
jgi:type II secretion system protein J